jgi:hypothetical protein
MHETAHKNEKIYYKRVLEITLQPSTAYDNQVVKNCVP